LNDGSVLVGSVVVVLSDASEAVTADAADAETNVARTSSA
jgi:hypothetical protein